MAAIEVPDLLDDESALGAVLRLQEHPPSILFRQTNGE
jgi:hypothetical protein